MNSATTELPLYYTRLEPFRDGFDTAIPVITYHKLGPRPRGVRLKGLYLDIPLFRRQLAEWKAAGFTAGELGEVAHGPGNPRSRVVLTFDDGFENVLHHGLQPLQEHGFTALQYLVAERLGRTNDWELRYGEASERLMNEEQVGEWLAAGNSIGSHTLTHPHLTRISLDQARAEIRDSRRQLEDRFGVPVRHFCYPFGDWNRTIRDLVAEAGYETACTTVPGFNSPGEDRFALKRLTARYASRKWGNVGRRVRHWFRRLTA
jgi:peptidoglycan/xylan/chitin deacetylase (PgdA/CDA1 family)